MFRSLLPRPFLLLSAVLFVTACQSGEERAEEFYQNALRLMEAGDIERASVEFRNVFDHNGLHQEAREAFAAMLRREGDIRESYAQYLRLVEQYPDHLEARVALTQMALTFDEREEARRHGARVLELAPDTLEGRVIAVSLDYMDAAEAEDGLRFGAQNVAEIEAARRAVHDRALALLQEDPGNPFLLRIDVDSLERDGAHAAALEALDRAMAVEPGQRSLYNTRLRLLATLERGPELEALLLEMIELFPEERELPVSLLRFYMLSGQPEAAQDFLRARAAAVDAPDLREEALVTLVQLRLETEGREAALSELDAAIADYPEHGTVLHTLRASLRFDVGQRDAAMSELRDLLEGEISREDAGRIRVALAQMLLAAGDAAEARQLVEAVLAEDMGQVEALKMLAAWLIEEDDADQAIARLRTALETSPDDVEALSLMADAHFRNGNRQLAREFLALAVEASGSAPAETLRYATVLIEDGRHQIAEELLLDALSLAPDHPDLLSRLGELYLRVENWSSAEEVEERLRTVGTPETVVRANNLRAALLALRGQTEQALAFLEQLSTSGAPDDLGMQIGIVRARLALGETARALSFAEELLAEDPEDPARRLTLAAVQSAVADHAAAEALYRGLLEDLPDLAPAWIGLVRALNAQQQPDAARNALEQALQTLPDAPDLIWMQASRLELDGDLEGAIVLYERLYAMMPNEEVVANNLASLLSTAREDEASLARASVIARRLRDSSVPHFQDTYGWIAYRRGDLDEALAHLEPAAAALTDDPLVQFHLGMTYLALGRADAALDRLRRAVDLAGPDDPRRQFGIARTEIASLEAALSEGQEGAEGDE